VKKALSVTFLFLTLLSVGGQNLGAKELVSKPESKRLVSCLTIVPFSIGEEVYCRFTAPGSYAYSKLYNKDSYGDYGKAETYLELASPLTRRCTKTSAELKPNQSIMCSDSRPGNANKSMFSNGRFLTGSHPIIMGMVE